MAGHSWNFKKIKRFGFDGEIKNRTNPTVEPWIIMFDIPTLVFHGKSKNQKSFMRISYPIFIQKLHFNRNIRS